MIRLLSIILLFLIAATVCGGGTGTALALETIDGDTIQIPGGKVRYIGIDAPEKGECLYLQATNANYVLTQGQKIQLVKDTSDRDKYDRWLRYVYVGDIMVNEEMLRRGLARAASYEPDTANARRFQELENTARSQQLGIWGPACAK